MSIVVTTSVTEGNLLALRTTIQQKGYGLDTASAIQNSMINSVYRRVIGMRRWPFLEVASDSTISTIAGENNYDLGVIADLLHVDAVRAEYGTNYYDLEYKPPQELQSYAHVERTLSVPLYWTRIGNQIRLYPYPDLAYVLKIDYIKDPSDLSGDTDIAVIPPAYQDVLVWGAIKELTFRERDNDGYNIASSEYTTVLRDMMNEYGVRQRQSSDQARYSGMYDFLDE